ncbi:unknown [Clostridium sp. CAG:389]|nr:unknown [Clostridium sp. CAG:389]
MNKAIIGIVSKHYASYKNDRTDTYVRDEIKSYKKKNMMP